MTHRNYINDVRVTDREKQILDHLRRGQGFVDRWTLLQSMTDQSIVAHIKRLRKKGFEIKAHYGEGYKLHTDVIRGS